MTVYSKFNIVYYLQKWMDSVPGQTFLNYAYSWGASVVILGTLFKLTHLPGANIMLFLGMGTEVLVFFLSAFDRPFDKTQDGKELPTHYDDDDETDGLDGDDMHHGGNGGNGGSGTIIIGGGMGGGNTGGNRSGEIVIGDGGFVIGGGSGDNTTPGGGNGLSGELGATLDATALMASNREIAEQLSEAQASYLEELKKLTETLQKVSEQSVRLTRDSEEMENLNRTLTGICKVYEMQLKGASQQIGTIDEINEQSRKMAQQIEQLNAVYARMIEAMTVNMRGGGNAVQ